MAVLGIDLGATKISAAIFNDGGDVIERRYSLLEGRGGDEAGKLISSLIGDLCKDYDISGAGICVPGIVYSKKGTVWCPNIPGWDDYPLAQTLKNSLGDIRIEIESDRTCYILGEKWRGAARGCDNAIYLAVGSGIGAGILLDGRVIHGADDIVGATGWMALESDYDTDWDKCGCFETFASGNGIGYQASKVYGRGVIIILDVNVSPSSAESAVKWAQPIAIRKTRFCASEVGSDAALIGAGYLVRN